MKFTYLILVHKNPLQLKRLILALDNENSTFIIHVDSKISIWPFIKQLNIPIRGRLLFVPKRVNVRCDSYSYSIVEAIMNMIVYFFKLKVKSDYIHLLSGQDYPIESNVEIADYFEKNKGKNYINCFSNGNIQPWDYLIEKKYYQGEENGKDVNYSLINFFEEYVKNIQFSDNIELFRGSKWWSLHYKCLEYIYDQYINNLELFQFFHSYLQPENIIFQTILMNSEFKDRVVNQNLRYNHTCISGKDRKKNRCIDQYKEVYPEFFLFARKFNAFNDKGLDEIDLKLGFPHIDSVTYTNVQKYCVISVVGKDSIHRSWLQKDDSHDYDVHLVVYDGSYTVFKNDAEFVTQAKGHKLKCVYDYLIKNSWVLDYYDYFFVPDDDILIDNKAIGKLFTLMQEYSLDIAQPALVNSYYTFEHTLKVENSFIRYTNFVEMMLPCFSKKALKKVLFTFNENISGWGADHHWGKIIDYEKHNMAIIDDVEAIHIRPIQSRNQRNIEELNNYIRKYNLNFNISSYT